MWKSLVPARCPRLWQELPHGRKLGSGRAVTVLLRNVSSFRTRSLLEGRSPSYGVSDGAKRGEGDGDASVSSWSMRLRRDAIGARRGGVRAAIAGEEVVVGLGLRRHVVARAIGDGEGRGGSSEEVVNPFPTEDSCENPVLPSREGGKSGGDAGLSEVAMRRENLLGDDDGRELTAVDVRILAEDADADADPELRSSKDREQNGGSKRDASRFYSEGVTGGSPRIFSLWVRECSSTVFLSSCFCD